LEVRVDTLIVARMREAVKLEMDARAACVAVGVSVAYVGINHTSAGAAAVIQPVDACVGCTYWPTTGKEWARGLADHIRYQHGPEGCECKACSAQRRGHIGPEWRSGQLCKVVARLHRSWGAL
jgi:hypothetical protein